MEGQEREKDIKERNDVTVSFNENVPKCLVRELLTITLMVGCQMFNRREEKNLFFFC